MNTNELIQRVKARLADRTPREELARLENQIGQASFGALAKLARADAAGPRTLTKTFTLEAADGDAPLADALAEDEPLLLEFFSNCSVYIVGSDYPVPPAPDRGYQALARPGRCSYVLEGESLRVVGPDGAYTGDVTLRRAPFIPELPSVEPPLDDALVELVAAVVAPPPVKRPRPQPLPKETLPDD